MSGTPCPKCGSSTDLVGSKLVCGECYWVFDAASGPANAKSEPQLSSAPKPKLSKDPNAPLPKIDQGPPATLAPRVCPKCSAETADVGGRLVCGTCYWVGDGTKLEVVVASPSATDANQPDLRAFGVLVIVILVVIMVFLGLRH